MCFLHTLCQEKLVMCEKGEKIVKSVSIFVKFQEVVRDNHRFSHVNLVPVTHVFLCKCKKIVQRCHKLVVKRNVCYFSFNLLLPLWQGWMILMITFVICRWLDVGQDDGKIERELFVGKAPAGMGIGPTVLEWSLLFFCSITDYLGFKFCYRKSGLIWVRV